MDDNQLALIAQGQAYKRLGGAATPWTVASHFTVFSYKMDVPLDTKDAAFTAFDARATDPATLRVGSAQFNRYNFGGCERGLMSYFTKYVNQGAAGVDHHFSGHSHRSALIKANVSDSGFRVTALASGVQVRALGSLDPGIVGELDAKTAAGGSGTAFIVSSCGGPIGVQNLTGELSGWTLRPPSGTLLDGSKIRQLKTTRQAPAQGHNEKPRLAVALDYLHVMGQDKDLKINQPLLMCDPVEARLNPHSSISSALSVFGRPSTRVDDDLPEYVLVRESAQLAKLNCVADIKVWVFEGGGADDFGDESPGAWKTLPVRWDPTSRLPGEHGAMFSKLTLGADAKGMLKRLMVPIQDTKEAKRTGEQVLQAFCEVALMDPSTSWSGDMDCTDPWTFPLEIAMLNRRTGMGNFKTFLFRRPLDEKGELPDWAFLAEHFENKGYIRASLAINPKKK